MGWKAVSLRTLADAYSDRLETLPGVKVSLRAEPLEDSPGQAQHRSVGLFFESAITEPTGKNEVLSNDVLIVTTIYKLRRKEQALLDAYDYEALIRHALLSEWDNKPCVAIDNVGTTRERVGSVLVSKIEFSLQRPDARNPQLLDE